MTAKMLWDDVRHAAAEAGSTKLAAHDLRRTCGGCADLAGGELDQIQGTSLQRPSATSGVSRSSGTPLTTAWALNPMPRDISDNAND
jgi:hypothetical protein